ncbi:MAG: hypothetical protein ACOCXA_09720, partial [Planctomycetota bacterium]
MTTTDADAATITDRVACVRRGNVHRDLVWFQQGLSFVPVYVANGALGGCVDAFGLHSRANFDMDEGRTHVAHVDHYSRRLDGNGGHILRSLFHLTATGVRGEEPGWGLLDAWQQELDLWTASCSTTWREGSAFATRVFASWATPQLWCWELDQELADPADALHLRLECDVRAAENNARKPGKRIDDLSVTISQEAEDCWRIVSETDCRSSTLLVQVQGATVQAEDAALLIEPDAACRLRVLVLDRHLDAAIAADPRAFLGRDDHRQRHEAAVAAHWRACGLLELPADTPEASWWPRYAYYLPASLSPDPSHIQVAHGLNANNWGHGFPQDHWYGMMALPRLGLHERTAAQLPYYNDDLPAYERYTQRLCRRPGVFFPWEAPFEDLDEFELDGPTNDNSYQFHN